MRCRFRQSRNLEPEPIFKRKTIDTGVRIDQTFLFEIEMCGLRREDLNDKIRCSFRSPVGEKAAPPLGKEGQVRLENIDVGQNHIKRRIVEDPNRLCFAGGALDQIKLAYPTQPLRR